jgi:hypothetical protein
MIKRNLVLLGWLALTLGAGGCTQKIAKLDAPAPADNPAPAGTAAAPAAPAQDAPAAPAAEQVAVADAPAQATPAPPAPAPQAAAAPSAATQDTAAAPAPQAAVTAKADQDAATAKPEQDTAKAAPAQPLPPQEIADTIKKLTHNPRARYLSGTAQYDYYIGGRLDAKYGLNDNQLIVTSDGDGNQVKCEYSNDGKMVSDGKTPPKLIDTCNTLITELGDFLSR